MIVQGQDILLKVSNGGALNSIACNASCALEMVMDTLETTFEETGADRTWLQNKRTTTLRGSGPIFLDRSVRASDVMQFMLDKTELTWEFSGSDTDGNTMVYSGTGFFEQCTIEGTIGQAATCDYLMRVNGGISIVAPPPTGEGDPEIYTYEATGGETTISDSDIIGAVMLDIEREGIGLQIITAGTPTGSQVKFTSATGTLEFGYALGAGEWINGLYII
jgi:predicted secreted protein